MQISSAAKIVADASATTTTTATAENFIKIKDK